MQSTKNLEGDAFYYEANNVKAWLQKQAAESPELLPMPKNVREFIGNTEPVSRLHAVLGEEHKDFVKKLRRRARNQKSSAARKSLLQQKYTSESNKCKAAEKITTIVAGQLACISAVESARLALKTVNSPILKVVVSDSTVKLDQDNTFFSFSDAKGNFVEKLLAKKNQKWSKTKLNLKFAI